MRTSDSGYLTRRLIDVAQDVITVDDDCGTTEGVIVNEPKEKGILPPLAERILGRISAADIVHPQTKESIVARTEEITEQIVEKITGAGLTSVLVRSPLTCQSRRGTCRLCYGRDLARGSLVETDVAVGIVAAESIGEPGTQLTLRTFHTGGVVGLDITSGLPRVEELFEARTPRGQAIISEIDGTADIVQVEESRRIKIVSAETYQDEYPLPAHWKVMVKSGQFVDIGTILASPGESETEKTEGEASKPELQPLVARFAGEVNVKKKQLVITYAEKEEREYIVPSTASIWVQSGDKVKAGQQLTDGSINPHDILRILGKEAAQQYLVDEVQKVYRSQGVNINDKHIEVITHQMLTKVRIDSAGDTDLVPDELIDKFAYEDINAKILAEGGEPATAHTVLLGITRASLSTESWLAAASFQETTRILTEAAANGRVDRLVGLKENVIIGKLIPARYLTDAKMAELMPPPKPTEQDEAARLLASLAITEDAPAAAEGSVAVAEKEGDDSSDKLEPEDEVLEPDDSDVTGDSDDFAKDDAE